MSTPLRSHPNPALRRWRFAEGAAEPNLFYRFCRWWLRFIFVFGWKTRVFNRHVEPTTGGVVYICNHQSFFDPPLMSFALRRPMNFMARDTLFRKPGFRKLIESLNAFPVRRGSADTKALKEAVARIKDGGQVVVFPEGTRTEDGTIGPFLPGVALLAQRARATTVPVLIDGAFECWPRWKKLPSPGQIIIQYGKPISPAEARRMSAQEFVDSVRNQLIEIQKDVRERMGRAPLRYD